MRLPLVLAACLLPLALANPTANYQPKDENCDWDGKDGHHPRHGCLTDHAARIIVSKFESLFVKIDPNVAKKFLTPNFQLFSDSTNFATPNASQVPGAIVSTSRANFIQQQIESQSRGIGPGFDTLNVMHSCDSITFRWRLGFQPIGVTGIDLILIKPGTYMIETDYSEFNNLGLIENFGCKPVCGS